MVILEIPYLCLNQLKIMINSILLGILGGLGGSETILIIVALLLFFGGKRIPELAKGLGQGIKEFKDASKGGAEKKEEETPKIDQK